MELIQFEENVLGSLKEAKRKEALRAVMKYLELYSSEQTAEVMKCLEQDVARQLERQNEKKAHIRKLKRDKVKEKISLRRSEQQRYGFVGISSAEEQEKEHKIDIRAVPEDETKRSPRTRAEELADNGTKKIKKEKKSRGIFGFGTIKGKAKEEMVEREDEAKGKQKKEETAILELKLKRKSSSGETCDERQPSPRSKTREEGKRYFFKKSKDLQNDEQIKQKEHIDTLEGKNRYTEDSGYKEGQSDVESEERGSNSTGKKEKNNKGQTKQKDKKQSDASVDYSWMLEEEKEKENKPVLSPRSDNAVKSKKESELNDIFIFGEKGSKTGEDKYTEKGDEKRDKYMAFANFRAKKEKQEGKESMRGAKREEKSVDKEENGKKEEIQWEELWSRTEAQTKRRSSTDTAYDQWQLDRAKQKADRQEKSADSFLEEQTKPRVKKTKEIISVSESEFIFAKERERALLNEQSTEQMWQSEKLPRHEEKEKKKTLIHLSLSANNNNKNGNESGSNAKSSTAHLIQYEKSSTRALFLTKSPKESKQIRKEWKKKEKEEKKNEEQRIKEIKKTLQKERKYVKAFEKQKEKEEKEHLKTIEKIEKKQKQGKKCKILFQPFMGLTQPSGTCTRRYFAVSSFHSSPNDHSSTLFNR